MFIHPTRGVNEHLKYGRLSSECGVDDALPWGREAHSKNLNKWQLLAFIFIALQFRLRDFNLQFFSEPFFLS